MLSNLCGNLGDLLFVQRKISGTALLAARLKARVDVRSMVMDTLGGEQPSGKGSVLA